MEEKYWGYINFVGRLENMNEDAERLLKRVGAWEEYGQNGWGPYRNESIISATGGEQSHKTGSNSKIYQWFTPEKERRIEKFYIEDYDNKAFNFKITNLTEPIKSGKIMKQSDFIYKRGDWDGAPVVVRKYKLIFFTLPKVGATKWKQAFRRMESYMDWKKIGGVNGLPHNPKRNGLKYLYDYSLEEAEAMMTDPEWTKAIFVRSPKDRFLSVFTQMKHSVDDLDARCCPNNPGCSSVVNNMVQFIGLTKMCYSTHWVPYSERIDKKWWKHINFIGRLENAAVDSKRLLKLIGAWKSIGKTGWGEYGDEPLFVPDDNAFESVHQALGKYSPKADKLLNDYYKADYENKYLNFTSKKVYIMGH